MAQPNVSITPTLHIKQVGQRRRGSGASLIADAISLFAILPLLATINGHNLLSDLLHEPRLYLISYLTMLAGVSLPR